MRRNKTKKTKLVALLLILVLLISIGYAALTTNLVINGTATVKHQSWNVHFTNIVVDTVNNNVKTVDTAPTLSNNDTTVTWGVSMDTPGQVYKFNVDVINEGSMDAMVNTATNSIVTSALTEAQQEYLDYTITYSDGAAIEQYDKLSAGDTVTLTIKLLYKNDDSVNPNELPQTAQNGIRLSYTAEYVQADTTNAKARTKYLSGATIKVDGTAVGNENVTVYKGETSAISIDNNQGMENITYTSSNTSVATVNSSGTITGVAVGTTTITLTGATSGVEKAFTVQVETKPIEIGDTVNYSTSLNEVTLNNWKVFDVEGDYTYLILDGFLPNSAVDVENIVASGVNDYNVDAGSDEVSRSNFIDAMTTKSNWNELVTNGKINGELINQNVSENVWAIGSPTLQLYVNSWNKSYPNAHIYMDSVECDDGCNGYFISLTEDTLSWQCDYIQPDSYDDYVYEYDDELGEDVIVGDGPRTSFCNAMDDDHMRKLYDPYGDDTKPQDAYGYWIATGSWDGNNSYGDVYTASYGYVESAWAGDHYYFQGPFALRPVIKLPSSVVNQ